MSSSRTDTNKSRERNSEVTQLALRRLGSVLFDIAQNNNNNANSANRNQYMHLENIEPSTTTINNKVKR